MNALNFSPVLLSSYAILNRLRYIGKSSGIDTITAKLLRDATLRISTKLSLVLGDIPDEWKVGR